MNVIYYGDFGKIYVKCNCDNINKNGENDICIYPSSYFII